MKPEMHHPASSQQGVVILEALIAILIFSFGVLGIVGMQANMVKNTSESNYRSEASYIAQQQIGTLWATPDSLPADGSTTVIVISDQLPSGSLTIMRSGDQYTVTVSWQQPGEAPHNYTTIATVTGV